MQVFGHLNERSPTASRVATALHLCMYDQFMSRTMLGINCPAEANYASCSRTSTSVILGHSSGQESADVWVESLHPSIDFDKVSSAPNTVSYSTPHISVIIHIISKDLTKVFYFLACILKSFSGVYEQKCLILISVHCTILLTQTQSVLYITNKELSKLNENHAQFFGSERQNCFLGCEENQSWLCFDFYCPLLTILYITGKEIRMGAE